MKVSVRKIASKTAMILTTGIVGTYLYATAANDRWLPGIAAGMLIAAAVAASVIATSAWALERVEAHIDKVTSRAMNTLIEQLTNLRVEVLAQGERSDAGVAEIAAAISSYGDRVATDAEIAALRRVASNQPKRPTIGLVRNGGRDQ